MSIRILNASEALQIIENIKFLIDEHLSLVGSEYTFQGRRKKQRKGQYKSSGLGEYYKSEIDHLISTYDEVIVGSALESVWEEFDFAKLLVLTESEFRDPEIQDKVVEQRDEFDSLLQRYLDEVIDELERIEAEDEEEDEDENRELTDEEAEEYNRLRRRWQQKKRRGYTDVELPSIITRGVRTLEDFRNLEQYIERILE